MSRSIVAFAIVGFATAAQAGVPDRRPAPAPDNAVLRWNGALLQAVRTVRSSPVVTARALAITHTCMYDAWAAYDRHADGTGRGPTNDISPFSTFQSCGHSSMENLRRKGPMAVRRGSS